MSGLLIVFDFDNTLVDGNTDLEIIKLEKVFVPSLCLPDEDSQGWSYRMTSALEVVHKHHVNKSQISELMIGIPLIPGFQHLLHLLERIQSRVHTIHICSHANSYFIDVILNHHNARHVFRSVNTFEATWLEDGSLKILPYHSTPTGCSLCPSDFCKGEAFYVLSCTRTLPYAVMLCSGSL